MKAGIIGLGVHLPDERRDNSWWPAARVERWAAATKSQAQRKLRNDTSHLSVGEKLVFDELASSDDPFAGCVERRVAAADATASDMEILAAKNALSRTSVQPGEIDLVLTYSPLSERLMSNPGCTTHENLGFARDCLTFDIQSACNTFQHQLSVATELIESGSRHYAMLLQSNLPSRILPYEKRYSALFGDGTTAVIVGPVDEPRGLIASHHTTDGSMQDTIFASVPGGAWYDSGAPQVMTGDLGVISKMFLGTADRARDVILAALSTAGIQPEDVDFYACHQGTSWLRSVTQAHAGMVNAKSVDTFAWAGNLSAVNIPLVLSTAENEGLLEPGDVVVTYAGGSGVTDSSTVMRW